MRAFRGSYDNGGPGRRKEETTSMVIQAMLSPRGFDAMQPLVKTLRVTAAKHAAIARAVERFFSSSLGTELARRADRCVLVAP